MPIISCNSDRSKRKSSISSYVLIPGLLIMAAALLFTPSLPQTAPTAEAAGQELTIAFGVDPDTLDPAEAVTSPSNMVSLHMLETLFERSPEGEIEPLLARDYQVLEEGQEYEITLREGIEFHDGTYFDAEAVKYNLERIIEEEGPNAFLIDRLDEIEIKDDYRLRLRTEEPFAPLITNLANQAIAMISPAALEEYGEDISSNPVGTGPFVFSEWSPGEEIIVERNEKYRGGVPELERLSFEIVPEDSARVIMVETGEADAIMGVPPQDRERLVELEEVEVVEIPSMRTMFTGFNTQREPFDDPQIRRALNYAVDSETIVSQLLNGAGIPSQAPIAPSVFGHSEEEIYSHDPDRAEEMLAEAGYEDGFSANLYHPVGRYMEDEIIAQAIQSQLADIGVEVELITMEWTTLLETIAQPPEEAEHDMYLLGFSSGTGDADYSLYSLFHSSQWPPAGNAFSYYENEELDELLEKARLVSDPAERENIYADASQLIWQEAPWIFLHSEVQLNAVRENVEGLIHYPEEYISARDARIVE